MGLFKGTDNTTHYCRNPVHCVSVFFVAQLLLLVPGSVRSDCVFRQSLGEVESSSRDDPSEAIRRCPVEGKRAVPRFSRGKRTPLPWHDLTRCAMYFCCVRRSCGCRAFALCCVVLRPCRDLYGVINALGDVVLFAVSCSVWLLP